MRRRARTLVAVAVTFVLVAPRTGAQATLHVVARPDVVTLRNGDRVTGEITGYRRGTLVVDGDQVGLVSLDRDDVATIDAPRPFEVELYDGRRLRGTLAPADAGRVVVRGADGSDTLALRAVATLRPVREGLVANLDGDLTLGVTWLRSSRTSTTSLAARAWSRRTDRETDASADVLVTTVAGRRETARTALLLTHLRTLEGRWFASAQGRLERNRNLGYSARATLLPSIGRRVVVDVRTDLTAGAGLSVLSELDVAGTRTQRAEATASARWLFDGDGARELTVDAQGRLFVGLGASRIRSESDVRLRRKLVGDVTIGLSVFASTDSRPPAGATTRADVGVTTTLGWSF